jgi:succinate-semialdehyde dehydrogenase / glutarate-semialdehyde dehydrogenase
MIQSPLLQNFKAYVAGKWVGADSAGATFAVHNPASGEKLADLPNMGAVETSAAIESSAAALERDVSLDQRRQWLRRIYDLLMENKQELARIITVEQGKPLKESVVEVEYSAGFFSFFADQLHHLDAEPLPERIRGMRWTIHHRPAGVAGLITPWNFPLAMLAKKLAPALAAGCATVTKPPCNTPLTSVALWHLLEKVGIPAGRANLVLGRPRPIGDTLCSHPAVRIISFTGSTEVGKVLMANVAPHVKRLAMELGGNAPYIVLADADLAVAADSLMANKFRCAGQTCVCANRILVHRDVAEAFTREMANRIAKLNVGNGLEEGVEIGPLINRDAFDKVAQHVKDAIDRGAKRIVGGDRARPANEWGAFFTPTLLTGATSQMLVSRDETFGPVVAIATFETDQQAVQLANSTEYGLAAYLFTKDAKRAEQLTAKLKFGHVAINSGTGPAPQAPFGGMKQSGFGREGGVEGMMEFCESQVVVTP